MQLLIFEAVSEAIPDALEYDLPCDNTAVQLLQNDPTVSTFDQLKAAFGSGPLPVGELVAAGLGGARYSVAAVESGHALPLLGSI